MVRNRASAFIRRKDKVDALIGKVSALIRKRDAERKRKLMRTLAERCGRQIVYCDVGALWGVKDEIRELNEAGYLQIIGFEPDAAECGSLNAANQGRARFYPYCLGEKDGERILYKTRFGACSSLLRPNNSLLAEFEHYLPLYEVESEIPMRCARFDTLQVTEKIPPVDFLKCDTQGFEYEVLTGFGQTLENVIGIELETHTKPMYEGEKLLSDLIGLLTEQGFILRDLRPTFPLEYDLFEFDAFFSRNPRITQAAKRPFLALWEAIQEIPPGRSVHHINNKWEWISLKSPSL
jgi:FkbM family methyltransferase